MKNFAIGRILQHRVSALVALALIVSSAGLYAIFSGGSAESAAADSSRSSLLANLLGRSPGERTDNLDLLKKSVSALAKRIGKTGNESGAVPEQRALGKIFDQPPEEAVRIFTERPPLLADMAPPAPGLLGIPRIIPGGSPPLSVGGGGSSGGGVTPGGGGSGGSGGGGTGGDVAGPGDEDPSGPPGAPPPDTEVVAAVPEPATWISLILGMFATAYAMRTRTVTRRGVDRACATRS